MSPVTAPEPPDSPQSRRAARALREEAARRALDTDPTLFSPFVLPDELVGADLAPVSSTARPGALPPDFGFAPTPPPAAASAKTPSVRPRPGRGRRRAVVPSARRAARADGILALDDPDGPPRHARPRRIARIGVVALIAAGGALLVGSTAAVTALVSGAPGEGSSAAAQLTSAPPPVSQLPVPLVEQTPVSLDICADQAVIAALEAGDDDAAIVAAGGGEWFRLAVAGGDAPCVDLADPTRLWFVVNKTRQFDPVDYWPADMMFPEGVRSLEGGSLRADASAALTAMVTGAREAGVGEIALLSGFRSYQSQMATYGRHVDARGVEGADLVSARPGYSEHQSGLSGDVVPCAGPCGTLDDLAPTAQGEWVAAHSWEYGWIVRYVEGATDVTGYLPEPWHLRYIGPDLARAYHDGGWKSLEEFLGLPPAPGYVG